MQFLDNPDPLIVIVGPTAVGKTVLAIEVAGRLAGEIVSADSRQFYSGMDIGTAKPGQQEMQTIPHHLIDIAEPDQPLSLVAFQEAARNAIASIHARNHLPFLVGGTGQYIQAVLEGWQAPQQPPDLTMRRILEEWGREIGPEQLYQRLRLLDAEAASHIEPRNLRRIVRALEVIFTTGRPFSQQKTRATSPYSLCIIGLKLPRPELYQRVDARIDRMVENGLLDEVRLLLQKGYSPDSPPFSAIGYREMVFVIRGEKTMAEAVASMKRLTRQYIRRQSNWFKQADPKIHWFDAREIAADDIIRCIQNSESWIRKPEK
ncbi:MAG TPA: tRNA (adenosine(37)-N6)-dimethylallyltransferase MiaA [Anaerolineaceae bacterium]|nr:tRNA (adenosine(37)-N6)-dimethylallyltransferase MiaA [Anaerolineaceae bacterium]